jgi:uncharacterized protein
MQRREFLSGAAASFAFLGHARDSGTKLAEAARKQLNVTTGYDPTYVRMAYPGGDIPRTTGVCADVVIRAARDGLGLDLQKLVHEDMARDFAAYPKAWGTRHPDTNIDQRRVLNLEAFWRRAGAALWTAQSPVDGDAFPPPIETGDLLTWLLDGRLPHVGIVVETGLLSPRVVHNIGGGVQENALLEFRTQRAKGHYRWPTF